MEPGGGGSKGRHGPAGGGKRGKGSYPTTSPALTTPFLSKGTALELGLGRGGGAQKK